MRHHRAGKKLGRDTAHRKALYANLTGALLEHGRIKTTEAKAKAVRPIAEKMITLGRRGDIHARRQALGLPICGPRTSSTSSSPTSGRA
jgi:large subunit ribosomal protein L17